jgi:DNA polymerase zeta
MRGHQGPGNASEDNKNFHHMSSALIRFRLTAIDTVQIKTITLPAPSSETEQTRNIPFLPRRSPFFDEHEIVKVPEIRIFGATDQGQRCCVHVHGALPYVYVEYTGSLNPEAGK